MELIRSGRFMTRESSNYMIYVYIHTYMFVVRTDFFCGFKVIREKMVGMELWYI